MQYDLGRVFIAPETQLHREPVFDVVMLGHTGKLADLNYLWRNPSMLADMRNAGYGELLQAIADTHVTRHSLVNLPVPLRSLEEYQSLFSHTIKHYQPEYISRLGGDYPWLPIAVADFFRANVMGVARRLWVIAVDETLAQEAFLPKDLAAAPAITPDNPLDKVHAVLRALALPDAALLLLPDFERLQIPAALKPIPRLRIANPAPAFLPCGNNRDDGVSERSAESVLKNYLPTRDFAQSVKLLAGLLEKYRKDMTLLLSFPFDQKLDGEVPRTSISALEQLQWLRKAPEAQLLRKVQLLYPYLQDAQGHLSSAAGLVAGKMLHSTSTRGSWCSIAGEPLRGDYMPFPSLPNKVIGHLRDDAGIGALRFKNGQLELDDERLAVAFFEGEPASNAGEIARFMGWLYRSLEKLGHDLVFDVETLVIKAEILLQDFLTRLFNMGALRGKTPEEAFSLTLAHDADGQFIFEISIAPAFPIERIQLDLRVDNFEVRNG